MVARRALRGVLALEYASAGGRLERASAGGGRLERASIPHRK